MLTEPARKVKLDPEGLVAALGEAVASPSYRPPTLPAVAMEVMQLASRPDVPFGEVVRLLERDPPMAARVLSLAQSAAYATRSPVLTLHQAAVRLGLGTLRELVMEAALHLKVFRVPGYDQPVARLHRHAVAVAHATRAVCRCTLVSAEYAFLCGLLHDVGFSGALLAVVERREWRRLSFEALAPVLDAVHLQVADLMLGRWKLPGAIRSLVATHHQVEVDGRPRQANAALVVAERLCWEMGAGLCPPPPHPVAGLVEDDEEGGAELGLDVPAPALLEAARRALRLDDAGLASLRDEVRAIVEQLGQAQPARA